MGRKFLLVIGLVAILAVAGIVTYRLKLLGKAVQEANTVGEQQATLPERTPELFSPSEASPASGSSTDPTADWKTYRNEQYGFEVKYPDGWKMFPMWDKRGAYFYDPELPRLFAEYKTPDTTLGTITVLYVQPFSPQEFSISKTFGEEIKVGGLYTGVLIKSPAEIEVKFPVGADLYLIKMDGLFGARSANERKRLEQIFMQVVQMFKGNVE